MQISNRLTSNINGMNVAIRNANDGISMAQTAEGALQETTNILQRMRDLALQSANGTNSSSDRKAIQEEIAQLQKEIDRIAETTSFGDQKLLDGSFGAKAFQVGANANETIDVTIPEMSASSLGTHYDATPFWGGRQSYPTHAPIYPALPATTLEITGHQGTSTVNIPPLSQSTPKGIIDTINGVSGSTGVEAYSYTDFFLHSQTLETHPVSFEIHVDGKTAYISGASSLEDLAFQISKADIGYKANVHDGYVAVRGEPEGTVVIGNFDGPSGSTLNVRPIDRNEPYDPNGESPLPLNVQDVVIHSRINFKSPSAFTINNSTSSLASVDMIDLLATGFLPNDADSAQFAIGVIDDALQQVDSTRALLGAVQNRLQHTITNLAVTAENSEASRSRIRDTDFAKETTEQVKQQILQQAGTSVLAQANQLPQAMLSLLNN
ncbi:B-type flagellin [Neiella marina]|uniref:Flagellin n=2 Tax=Neiella marina TaxID=508461 RepID=A0A8J2U2G9_9GAMM|nr:B-type flagellin [Neiella marina]